MNIAPPPRTRPYRMRARAEAQAATRDAIIDAAIEAFYDSSDFDPSLDAIAGRAGVSTRTILRHFGSKDGLLDASREHADARVKRDRAEAPPNDIPGAVANLVEHYEEWGDRAVRMLAAEERSPTVRTAVESGREIHRQWVERTLGHLLDGLSGARLELRLAQLVALTDVYTWKLLRRDADLSPAQTRAALTEMIERMDGAP